MILSYTNNLSHNVSNCAFFSYFVTISPKNTCFSLISVSLLSGRRYYSPGKDDTTPSSFEGVKPAVIYKDGDKDKLDIFADNRKKIGVYR